MSRFMVVAIPARFVLLNVLDEVEVQQLSCMYSEGSTLVTSAGWDDGNAIARCQEGCSARMREDPMTFSDFLTGWR